MKLIKDILFVISIIAVITIATLMGFNGMRVEMGIIIGLGIAIWFFLTIEKFDYFKGAGIEAKLNKAVNDANATIEELRELAVSLAEPTLTLITMENRMLEYIPLGSKIQMKEEIVNSLKKLNVADSKIQETTKFMDNTIINDHLQKIKYFFENKKIDKQIQKDYEEKFLVYESLTKHDILHKKLTEFLKERNLMDETISSYLEDLKYFIEHKKLRRPEDWQ